MQSIDQKITHYVQQPMALILVSAIIVWAALVGFSLNWNLDHLKNEVIQLATNEARANWNKDAAFRRWATGHGGVYVKPDERTPPNPYLAHLPKRDIETVDGTRLTLMNPAYMMRQMTGEFEETFGVKGKITGKILLNPINTPDEWESGILDRFEEEPVKEVFEEADIDGQPYLRYMKPMYMTEGCVKCHGFLGFKDGDLRGGVSVSIPLRGYLATATETGTNMKVTHFVVWLIGMLAILAFAATIRHRKKERQQLLSRLEHDALYDSLTGLPNRLLFTDRLEQAMRERSRDSEHQFAVVFLDLDRFKNLNDSYGHATGDQLLVQVAERLSHDIRPSDTVARMGGDEFTVLLRGLTEVREAMHIAGRLLASLDKPFEIDGKEISTDASIGVCMGDARYSTPDDLLRDADTAMYRAKSEGRGRVNLFDPQMHKEIVRTTAIEHALRGVLDRDEFSLHYQPVIDVVNGRIDGFEALLRWQHPNLGNLPPGQFIPIAEETGAIVQLGAWVMERACTRVRTWSQAYSPDAPFFASVNLSARQVIDHSITRTVEHILRDTDFPPDRLHCEVTETRLITEQDQAETNLSELRAMGIHLSADDFGKGYCSLTYLHRYQFDTLKIDREFVQSTQPGQRGSQLVNTLLMLADDLTMSAVAEGVENIEQYNRLRSMDCRWMQGYYLCPPLPAADIEALLDAGCHVNLETLLERNPRNAANPHSRAV